MITKLAGKTTFADYTSFLIPYFHCKKHNIPLDIIYYSFELGKVDKQARICSFLLDKLHKIRLTADDILGRSNKVITPQQDEAITQVSHIIEELFQNIIFIEEDINPDGIYRQMMEYSRNNGIFVDDNTYIPNNPNKQTIIIIDHIGLTATSKKYPTLKETMDTLSKYAVRFRNRFGYTWVIIQQFNTELTSTHRKAQSENSIAPQRLDFGDSKYTYRDADIVLGLVNPNLYGITSASGYSVSKCGDLLIELYLMKNRYGRANVKIPMLLNPTGSFIEIPKSPTNDQKEQIYKTATSYYLE